MAGYTRADGNDNIANGKVIDADDLDAEFDAIDAAFNSSTGHTHDGSANNGAPITKLGPGQQIQVTTTVLQPKDNNVMDLGIQNTKEFKNLYLAGNADIGGTLSVTGAQTLTGNTTLNGVVNIGSDTLAEYISDTVGSMFTGNTESGISVTYDDTDNTVDFDVDDFTITLEGDATGSVTITNLASATLSVAVGNDSHSHTSSTISDFGEAVQDAVGAFVTAGTAASVTYDDLTDSLTIAHGDIADAATTSTNTGRTYIQSLTFDTFGHVTGVTTATETVTNTDTNTTYSISAVDSGANAIIRLTDSGSGTDDVTLVAGTNVSVTPSGDNITLALDTSTDIAMATTKGIDFSANTGTATTGASTTSEILDFYEEGTFTPFVYGSSETTAPTHDFQDGVFTRIGNVVYFQLSVKITSMGGTSQGYVRIGGLPYNSNNFNNDGGGGIVKTMTDNLASSYVEGTYGVVVDNIIIMYYKQGGSAPESSYQLLPYTGTYMTSAARFDISGHYFV